MAKALKAEAQKSRDSPRSTTVKPRVKLTPIRNSIDDDKVHDNGTTDVKAALKAMKEEESELLFGDDANDDDNDDDEDDDEDEDYDEDDDDDDDDEGDTDEEIMTECPDYCRCSGQYADATTARFVLLNNKNSVLLLTVILSLVKCPSHFQLYLYYYCANQQMQQTHRWTKFWTRNRPFEDRVRRRNKFGT